MNRRVFLGTTVAAIIAARQRDELASIGLRLTAYDDATLSTVAAIGYRDVAVSDLYAPALRAGLDRAGLRASAVRVTTPLLYRGLERHLAAARALGCQYLVCGRLDPEERRTAQDWHELAALFNRVGEAVRKAGLKFAYKIQGDEQELMQSETDPALVWFEGNRLPSKRFFAIDLNDTTSPDLLRAAKAASIEHYYVETDSVDRARKTYAYLKGLRF